MNLSIENIAKLDDMLNSGDDELKNLGLTTMNELINQTYTDINQAKRELCRRAYALGFIHGSEILKELKNKSFDQEKHQVCMHFINFGIKQKEEGVAKDGKTAVKPA